MAEWDLILKYKDDIDEMAYKLCSKYDISLVEDAIQYTCVLLKDTLDVSKSRGPERDYVRGAIWNSVSLFIRDQRKDTAVSLDRLHSSGVQIDEDMHIRWPTPDGTYSGNYTEKDE